MAGRPDLPVVLGAPSGQGRLPGVLFLAGLLALSGVCAEAPAGGDPDPSIDETIDYIVSKLSACHRIGGRGAPSIVVSDGRMSVQSLSLLGGRRGRHVDDGTDGGTFLDDKPARMTVELGDLSREVGEPKPVRAWGDESFAVRMRCAGSGCIRYEGVFSSRYWADQLWGLRDAFPNHELTTVVNVADVGEEMDEWALVLCSRDAASRVRRALAHLIALGGGKAELF